MLRAGPQAQASSAPIRRRLAVASAAAIRLALAFLAWWASAQAIAAQKDVRSRITLESGFRGGRVVVDEGEGMKSLKTAMWIGGGLGRHPRIK